MELELIGGFGNLAYNKGRTSVLSDPVNPRAFSPQYFPLVLARLSGEYNGLAYNTGFERDPLLRNRLFANMKVETDFFSIEAGPFFGFFNSSKLPLNPGVSANLWLGVPGTVFLKAGGSSTLGIILMDKTGNYSQYSGDISVGFWVPYVICSLNMSIRNFTIRENAVLSIKDESVRYFFRADVHTKNVPYTISLDFGYQSLRRSYTLQEVSGGNIVSNTETDNFKSFFLGMEGTYTFSPSLKFLLGGEMPVYSWGARDLKKPSKGTMLFELRMGVIWTFGQ
jgi:hypothetical protein